MTDKATIDVILSLGKEGWERLTDAVKRADEARITASEVEDAMGLLATRCVGQNRVEIIPDAAIAALNAKSAQNEGKA